ncbi:MAG: SDR family NAD(P)-dependent oxidoreductase [Curvibacter sp.]|nr:SDR family NAD(P)-dependent oxidoreductase [Curvibacter sp.]
MPLNPPLSHWQGRKVWIIGASSGIGLALAERLHADGAEVLLSARRADLLAGWCGDRPNAWAYPLDVRDPAGVQAQWERLHARHGVPDLLVYAAGHYQPMRVTDWNTPEQRQHCEINYLGACHVLGAALPALRQAGHGHVSLIASVAGYRGLPQALAYGPTKAALINLAEILHHELKPLGVGVSLINPGFVDTALTARNGFPMPALLRPQQAADRILQGWARGRFEIDFPKRFTFWLRLGRWLPDRLYFSLLRQIAP